MQKIYAVGDIHGDFDKLLAIHRRITRDHGDVTKARVIHVGDLVDRRFKSRETIQYLLDANKAGHPWITLLGNHDRLFLRFLQDITWKDPILRPDYHWLIDNMGGRTTLASYGVDVSEGRPVEAIQTEARDKVPDSHRAYMKDLALYHIESEVLFVHAGIRPGIALQDQTEDDLIWIRKPFHDFVGPHPHLIVHGHTVIDQVTHYGNRINIDTGCAYGRDLSVVVIERGQVWVLEEDGRRALPSPNGT